MNSITINIERLNHLLKLYKLSDEDVLDILNKESDKEFTKKEIFKPEIKISLLKKIDSIFKKGLNYYLDPKDLKVTKEESIFFRKDRFNAELNIGAKQIVNHLEEEKIELSALATLSDLKITRKLNIYNIKHHPQKVALEIRQLLYPSVNFGLKEFLTHLIVKLAEYDVLVFEWIEQWNLKNKSNINGFFLTPNFIAIKRNQTSFKREIFTLLHELGHYLLNAEEIDDKTEDSIEYSSLSKVEKWCNDFAYYFLIGNLDTTLSKLDQASPKNDYHRELIESISQETNLSTIALYTRLLINNKIAKTSYSNVVNEILEEIQKRQEKEKLEKESERIKAKEEGRKLGGGIAKQIQSPLFLRSIQSAFYEGVIGEAEFCKRLNIKSDKIVKYLQ